MTTGNRANLNTITHAARVLASDNAFDQHLLAKKKVKNQSWDAVSVLSSTCAQLLVAGKGMMPALKNDNIRKYIDDVASLDANSNIVARELLSYADQLLELRKQQGGRTGEARGDDENLLAINIFTGLMQWVENFEAIVQPTINHMLEIIRMAEGKLREENNDAADAIGAETSRTLDQALGREPVQMEQASVTENTDPAASSEPEVD